MHKVGVQLVGFDPLFSRCTIQKVGRNISSQFVIIRIWQLVSAQRKLKNFQDFRIVGGGSPAKLSYVEWPPLRSLL